MRNEDQTRTEGARVRDDDGRGRGEAKMIKDSSVAFFTSRSRRGARERVLSSRSVAGEAAAATDDLPDAEPGVHLRGEESGGADLREGRGRGGIDF